MLQRIVVGLGLVVMAASGIWWFIDSRDDGLPEGAVAGGSLNITVGDPSVWSRITGPQWGLIAGGAIFLLGLIWMLAARGSRSKTTTSDHSD